MIDGWLNLAKFITSQFGLPGSMAVGAVIYLVWLLQRERDAHEKTRERVDDINEKRIEFTKATLETQSQLMTALQAVSVLLGKK